MFISIEIELFCVRLFCYLVVLSRSSALELALYAGGMLTQDKHEAGPGPCQDLCWNSVHVSLSSVNKMLQILQKSEELKQKEGIDEEM